MDTPERAFMGVAKAIAYAVAWATAAIIIYRFGVTSLLGSGSDLGVIAAPALGALGVVGLAWLALVIVRDLRRNFTR